MNQRDRLRDQLLTSAATSPAQNVRREAVRLAEALATDDPSIVGFTLILPSGDTAYIDASLLRRGGRA